MPKIWALVKGSKVKVFECHCEREEEWRDKSGKHEFADFDEARQAVERDHKEPGRIAQQIKEVR